MRGRIQFAPAPSHHVNSAPSAARAFVSSATTKDKHTDSQSGGRAPDARRGSAAKRQMSLQLLVCMQAVSLFVAECGSGSGFELELMLVRGGKSNKHEEKLPFEPRQLRHPTPLVSSLSRRYSRASHQVARHLKPRAEATDAPARPLSLDE